MITDQEARRIACDWHGGRGSALYALCSTGAIDTAREDHDIQQELEDTNRGLAWDEWKDAIVPLANLATYAHEHGPRGPVAGWSAMPWEES